MKYVYITEKASDGTYSAYVPDLPGCTTSADTLDEVHENIKEAVSIYLDSLREHNEPIPPPITAAGTVEAA
jgi:predicted RNase H-like HicB family nuclease